MHSPEFAVAINPSEHPDQQAFAEIIAQDPSARYSFQEEVGAINFGEIINATVSYTQIAYNGLRATWTERRAQKHQSSYAEKEHEAEIYEHLEDLATDVANEGVNLPPPPVLKKPLTREAASDVRLQAYKTAIEKDPYSLPPKQVSAPSQNTLSFDPNLPPRTKKQRKAMLKFARQAQAVRGMRRDQERDIKMYGSAGEHSWRGTKNARYMDKVRAELDYEAGAIDEFELLDRERARKAIEATNTPAGMAKRQRELDRFTEKAPSSYDKKAFKAQRAALKVSRKAQAAQDRAVARRQKQADARARLK